MVRPRRCVDEQGAGAVAELLQTARSANELRAAQCMHLRITQNLTAKAIADLIGWSEIGVKRVQCDFFKRGIVALRREPTHKGIRRHSHMSFEAEVAFLSPFQTEALTGGVLDVLKIHRALESHLGRRVGKSTVYDLLHRHNWRRITPRPRHPKADAEQQAAFKKTGRRPGKHY
jgi:transposase